MAQVLPTHSFDTVENASIDENRRQLRSADDPHHLLSWCLWFRDSQIALEYSSFFGSPKYRAYRVGVFFLIIVFQVLVLAEIYLEATQTANAIGSTVMVALSIGLKCICEYISRNGSYMTTCSSVVFCCTIFTCAMLCVAVMTVIDVNHAQQLYTFSQIASVATIIPAGLYFVFPTVSFCLAMLMWTVNTGCILYAQSELFPLRRAPLVGFGAALCLALLFALRFERIQLFLWAKNYQKANHAKLEAEIALEKKEEEVLKQFRVLLANTAHDLKTPLAAIIGTAELLVTENINMKHFLRKGQFTSSSLESTTEKLCRETIQMLSDVKQTGQFMISTINRVQDQAKLSQGLRLIPNLATFNCMHAIRTAVMLFGKAKFAGKVELLPFPEGVCPRIISDEQWLQENILCYLSNALKYCPEGGITLRVSVQPRNVTREATAMFPSRSSSTNSDNADFIVNEPPLDMDMIRIEVEDHGVGVSKEKQHQLFAPFSQAQSRAGGTGLGLYSLSKRIEALGGKYGVSDRRDGEHGALFWFSFPYRPDFDALENSHNTSSSNEISKSMMDSKKTFEEKSKPHVSSSVVTIRDRLTTTLNQVDDTKLRVLLVDDSDCIVKLMKRLLTKANYLVEVATNGFEAINILQKSHDKPFDVVIMDINMPVMDGLEATKRIRAKEESEKSHYKEPITESIGTHPFIRESSLLAQMPTSGVSDLTTTLVALSEINVLKGTHQNIVACSANGDDATVQEALQCGADAFIIKPFTLTAFQDIMKSLHLQDKL